MAIGSFYEQFEEERQTYSFTINLDDNQIEAWKDIVFGGKDNRAAVELAEKTINEIFPRYKDAYKKQVPMKPTQVLLKDSGVTLKKAYYCSACTRAIKDSNFGNEYCPFCGQRIDWTGEE